MKIVRLSNPKAFLDRAESWLLRREAEHNLVLGIAGQLVDGKHPYEEPVYLATVEHEGEVCGCAFRTPPFKLGLTRIPEPALPLLVDDVRQVYRDIPAVLGPESAAKPFATLWVNAVGGRSKMGLRQRIYSLERVIPPSEEKPGRVRWATPDDHAQVRAWIEGFERDSGIGVGEPDRRAAQLIEERALYLWDDGGARCMAAAVGGTPHGIRIGYVYTPPPLRGRGYASALVASVSQRLLDSGRRFCFLYTDLANRTANAIYQRIGYRPVSDVIDVNFLGTMDDDGSNGGSIDSRGR